MTDVLVIFDFGLFFAFLKKLEISFYTCVPKIMIRYCMVPKIWCETDRQMDRKSDT